MVSSSRFVHGARPTSDDFKRAVAELDALTLSDEWSNEISRNVEVIPKKVKIVFWDRIKCSAISRLYS
jgi:hypothetical protein